MTHETEVHANGNAMGGIIVASVVGMAVGLAIGFLYAPKTGREAREMVKDKTIEVRGKAGELIDRTKATVAKVRRGSQEAVKEAKSEMESP